MGGGVTHCAGVRARHEADQHRNHYYPHRVRDPIIEVAIPVNLGKSLCNFDQGTNERQALTEASEKRGWKRPRRQQSQRPECQSMLIFIPYIAQRVWGLRMQSHV